MTSSKKELGERIRELRRRHYGPRGKQVFAEALGVALGEYERYERGTLPPGDVLVRMCERTGEDLQWLLTGRASRGTVVISEARTRHRDLLTSLAQLLDDNPSLARPVEAFVDLLVRGEAARTGAGRELALPAPRHLIPIYEMERLPLDLPGSDGPDGEFPLCEAAQLAGVCGQAERVLAEPAVSYEAASAGNVQVLALAEAVNGVREYVSSAELAGCLPAMFGVRLADEQMRPMFAKGDAALVSLGSPPRIGRPAICRMRGEPAACCRIWLGADDAQAQLGRLSDGSLEHVELSNVAWTLEVLYRIAA